MAAGSSSSDRPSNSTGEKLVFDLSDDGKSKFMKLMGAGVESIPESKQSCLREELSSPVEIGKASMSGVGDSDESGVLPKSNIEPANSYVRNWFSNLENEKGKARVGGSDILGQIIGRGKNVGNIEDIRNLIAKVKEEVSNMPVTHDYQSRKRDHRARMLDFIEYVRNLSSNFEKEKGKAIAGGSGNLGQIIGMGKNVGNIEDIAKMREYKKVKMPRIRELYNNLQEEKLMSIPSRAVDSDKITSVKVVTEMSGIENVTADNKLQEEKFMSIPSGSCDSDKITSVEVVADISAIENVTADNKLQEDGGSGNLGEIIGRGKNVGNIEDIRNLIAKVKEEVSYMPVTHDYQSRKRDHRARMLDFIEYVRNLSSNFEKEKGKAIAGGSGNLSQIIGMGKNVGNIEDIAKMREYKKVKMPRIRELYNKLQEEKLISLPSRAGDSDKMTSVEVVTEMSGIENMTADNKLQEEKFMSITSGSCDSDKITRVEVVADISAIENVTADNKLQEEKFMPIPSGSCDSDKITSVEVVTQMSGIENVTAEMHAEISPQSLEMSELLDFNELLSNTEPQKRQRRGLDLFQFLPPLPALADPLQIMTVGSDYERTVMALRTNMTVPPPQVSRLGDQLSNMHLEAPEDGREEQSEDK